MTKCEICRQTNRNAILMPVTVYLEPGESPPPAPHPQQVVCNNCLGSMLDGGVVPLRGRHVKGGRVASLDSDRNLIYRPRLMEPSAGRVEPTASGVAPGSPPCPPGGFVPPAMKKRRPGRPRRVPVPEELPAGSTVG